jgi:hypothetical protein
MVLADRMSIVEKFIELEELLFLEEMIKEYSEIHLSTKTSYRNPHGNDPIKIHNEDRIHTILHFSTNINVIGPILDHLLESNEQQRLLRISLRIVFDIKK